MISNSRLRKEIQKLAGVDIQTGLTDEQVQWVKDKVAVIGDWKDTAVTTLTNFNDRIKTLEAKADIAQAKFKDIEDRLKALEEINNGGIYKN
jgi:hypothetical protein